MQTTETGWRGKFTGAFDGAAFSIPASLGSTALIFSRISPDLLAGGVLALMLVLSLFHIAQLRSTRPVVYSARFFESTMLAAMLEVAIMRLPSWGLPDTTGVRIALLCLLCASAGIWIGVLYLLRADRFTRYIPSAVFAGFLNSVGIALLLSQIDALRALLDTQYSSLAIASMAALVLPTGLVVRRVWPQLPAAAIGLAAGVLAGIVWTLAGKPPAMVGEGFGTAVLPVLMADFHSFMLPGVAYADVVASIAAQSAILALVMFINSTMAAQSMTQADGRRRAQGPGGSLWLAAVLCIAGLLGAPPISGSGQISRAASRLKPLDASFMAIYGGVIALIYLSHIINWVPLAALCGALLCEAWVVIPPYFLTLSTDWVRRRPMRANEREDLALIVVVTATAAIFNMVVALIVGLMLGLVYYAVRNAQRPVRSVWTGAQMRSNCARARSDQRLLSQRADRIKIFELEGDLFFGVADQFELELIAALADCDCAILDWSRVKHIDSNFALATSKVERYAQQNNLPLFHASAEGVDGKVASVLAAQLPDARFIPDLDHALEEAENHIVRSAIDAAPDATTETSQLESVSLFRGMTDDERARLDAAMEQRLYAPGEAILKAGDAAEELLLVLEGSASVMASIGDGKEIRLAGVRRGAMLGEIGFLEASTRSANVLANEAVSVSVLNASTYKMLCASDPELVRKLLSNVAVDLATRLRQTNRLAIARYNAQG